MQIFDQCSDIREMAEIDDETFEVIRRILFDTEDNPGSMPLLRTSQAGVLLEFMRDILYQSYVRRGKIQQAMMMRRYLAEDTADDVGDSTAQSAG